MKFVSWESKMFKPVQLSGSERDVLTKTIPCKKGVEFVTLTFSLVVSPPWRIGLGCSSISNHMPVPCISRLNPETNNATAIIAIIIIFPSCFVIFFHQVIQFTSKFYSV